MFSKLHISLLALFFCSTLLLAEHEDAKELFNDAACMDCHNNEDFKARKNKVNSFAKLHAAVDACRFSNEAEWFDDESEDVSKYLNAKFYKFKTE